MLQMILIEKYVFILQLFVKNLLIDIFLLTMNLKKYTF